MLPLLLLLAFFLLLKLLGPGRIFVRVPGCFLLLDSTVCVFSADCFQKEDQKHAENKTLSEPELLVL